MYKMLLISEANKYLSSLLRVHMGPGNYGLFPVHFLPIFWPRYSFFIREQEHTR